MSDLTPHLGLDPTNPGAIAVAGGGRRVGYILKQYPRLSETFILNEILGLEEKGVDTTIFSLRHAIEGRFHPAVARVRGSVHYSSDLDRSTYLATIASLPRLATDRLTDVLAFCDRLAPERRARTLISAIEVADRAVGAGVDHLHAHFLTVAAHTAHITHLLTGLPYTVTAHAKDIYRHTVDWTLAATMAETATAVVTVCDANLRYLAHRLDGTGANLVRVYNGLGPQDPPPAEARIPGLVLGVGRLVEKKGFDRLIDAMAELPAETRCLLIGDGEERVALERLASERSVADRVIFTGSLPQDQVAAWMRRAGVLVAPCRVGADGNSDALPTVLIEALAAGLPVVSTPVAGIPEIVTDGVEGLIVDPDNDPNALAAAISRLLTDTGTWTKMAAAGPVKQQRLFNRDRTIDELLAVMSGADSEMAMSGGRA